MEEAETLRTIAEVAITIAGFTGVVVVFGNRAGGKWQRIEAGQLWLLLYQSLMATLLAFLPILLHSAGLESQSIWRISNGIFAGAFLVIGVRLALQQGGLAGPEGSSHGRAYSTAAVSAAIVVAQLIHVAGVFPARGSFLFLLALLYVVGLALLNFWLLLMSSVADRQR